MTTYSESDVIITQRILTRDLSLSGWTGLCLSRLSPNVLNEYFHLVSDE